MCECTCVSPKGLFAFDREGPLARLSSGVGWIYFCMNIALDDDVVVDNEDVDFIVRITIIIIICDYPRRVHPCLCRCE